jgi:hypothetical protein
VIVPLALTFVLAAAPPPTLEEPPGFFETPAGVALVTGGAGAVAAGLYAAAVIPGTMFLYQSNPNTSELVLFGAFLGSPVITALVSSIASLFVLDLLGALVTSGATAAGAFAGLVTGVLLFFVVGPFLPDPAVFIWLAGLAVPATYAVVSAAGTAAVWQAFLRPTDVE